MGNCVGQSNLRPQNLSQQTKTLPKKTQIICNICNQHIFEDDKFVLTCGHTFGKECLSKAYTVKIKERNLDIKCPDCSLAVKYEMIGKIVPENIFALYDKTCLMNSLILAQNIFFCPTADCPGIYQIIPSQFRYFQCIFCAKTFCLICHKSYHGKSDCLVDQSQTPQGSVACANPKCSKPCVKISGCNIVQCLICKTKFCFNCQGLNCGHNKCANKKK